MGDSEALSSEDYVRWLMAEPRVSIAAVGEELPRFAISGAPFLLKPQLGVPLELWTQVEAMVDETLTRPIVASQERVHEIYKAVVHFLNEALQVGDLYRDPLDWRCWCFRVCYRFRPLVDHSMDEAARQVSADQLARAVASRTNDETS